MIQYDVHKAPSLTEEEPNHLHARGVSKGLKSV